jgi:large subunit ribosomal protein L15
MQVFRTAPKRGFNNARFRKEYTPINVCQLERAYESNGVVDPESIKANGISKNISLVKVLGKGELTKPLTVKAHAISASARKKIEDAGGSVTLLGGAAADEEVSAPDGEEAPEAEDEKA